MHPQLTQKATVPWIGSDAGYISLFTPGGCDGQVHPPVGLVWQEFTCCCTGFRARSLSGVGNRSRSVMGRHS